MNEFERSAEIDVVLRFNTTQINAIDTAKAYVGTKELPTNRGVEVEKFLHSVGLNAGNPWCAAFVSYCLQVTNSALYKRTGLAINYINSTSIKAIDVLENPALIDTALVIWRIGKGTRGHIGFTFKNINGIFYTVEGNTGNNTREGDGVYEKQRLIQPLNEFRIVYFTKL